TTRLGKARIALELVAVVAVGEGILAHHEAAFAGIAPFDVRGTSVAQVAFGLVVLLIVVQAIRSTRRRILTQAARRGFVAGVAITAVAAAVAVGFVDQRQFNDSRYRGVDPTIDWIIVHAPSGHRIGVTG